MNAEFHAELNHLCCELNRLESHRAKREIYGTSTRGLDLEIDDLKSRIARHVQRECNWTQRAEPLIFRHGQQWFVIDGLGELSVAAFVNTEALAHV